MPARTVARRGGFKKDTQKGNLQFFHYTRIKLSSTTLCKDTLFIN
jgi:hypothetical protein